MQKKQVLVSVLFAIPGPHIKCCYATSFIICFSIFLHIADLYCLYLIRITMMFVSLITSIARIILPIFGISLAIQGEKESGSFAIGKDVNNLFMSRLILEGIL
jgi:hypothetical protein